MFALKVPTHPIDLTTDAQLTLTVTSALTDPDHTARSYTFDTTAPHSPNNDHLFRHAYRLDAKQKNKLVAQLDIEGAIFQKGKVTLKDVTSDTYSIAYQSDNRAILDELGFDLATFAQETLDVFTSDVPVDFSLNFGVGLPVDNAQTFTVSITINGQVFGVSGVYRRIDNDDRDNLGEKAAELYDLLVAAFGGQKIVMENPMQIGLRNFFPADITNPLYCELNYTGGDAYKAHKSILANVQTRMEDPNSDVVFPVIYAPSAFENNPLFTSYALFNRVVFEGNKLVENDWQLEKGNWQNSIVPMFRVRYILKKIATRLKLTLAGTWWENPESQKLFLFNTVTMDETIEREVIVQGATAKQKQYFNTHKKTITPGDHLPDMTAKEFLAQLAEDYGFYLKVKHGKLYLNRKKDLRNAKPRNWTTKLATDSLKRNLINEGIKLSHNFPKEAPTPTGVFAPLSIGGEKTSVVLHFTPLMPYFYGLFAQIPHYWGKAGERPKTILLYRGIQRTKAVATATYAYASATNLDSTDMPITGAWSLAIGGAQGLYQQHLKGIVELKSAPDASALFYLSPEDVVQFERGIYSWMRADTPNGQLRAVITEMRLKLQAEDPQEFYEVEATLKII